MDSKLTRYFHEHLKELFEGHHSPEGSCSPQGLSRMVQICAPQDDCRTQLNARADLATANLGSDSTRALPNARWDRARCLVR